MGKSRVFIIGSLLFLLLNFVLVIYQPSLFSDQEVNQANFKFDQFYNWQGQILSQDKKLNGWQLIVRPRDLPNYTGKILVYAQLYPEYNYGDVLQIGCKLRQPEVIINDNGQKFFYDQYLAKDDIYATCYRPRIKWLNHEKNWQQIFFGAKQYFWQNLNNYLREPASSLAKAMLLAARREMPGSMRDIFSRTGLSHVVAISGLHIAIIVWILQSFLYLLGLSRQQVFFGVMIILLSYLFLLGFPSSAVRASLMVGFVLLGPFLGRPTTSTNSLLLAAVILVSFSPLAIVYDIGFQLSFLAVLGLLWYVDWWQRILKFIPNIFKIREMMAVTLAAQMFTWPLIVYYFHIFSFIAPVANLFILPLLPAVLILSLLLAVFGFVPFLASVIAWPLFILLKIIVFAATWLAQVPFGFIELTDFSLVYLLVALVFMFVLSFIIKPYVKNI
jgi:competence protein ComEC